MRRILNIVLLVFVFQLTIQAQHSVHVESAGTLSTQISASELYSIQELTVTGELDGRDLAILRDMAGNNSSGEITQGRLHHLDLSGARIVGGGKYLDTDKIYFQEGTGSASGDFHLEAKPDTLPVWCFYACDTLRTIVLPESLKAIGMGAFMDIRLESVSCGDAIKSIGERAFYHDIFLTDFNMPASVDSIGINAFAYCEELTEIDIPYTVKFIGRNAFRKCTHLNEVRSHMAEPCEISAKTFEGVTAKLTVPKGTMSLYTSAAYWNTFTNIEETDEEPRKPGGDEQTRIMGLKSGNVASNGAIYNLQGQRVINPVEGQLYIQNGRKFLMQNQVAVY